MKEANQLFLVTRKTPEIKFALMECQNFRSNSGLTLL